MSTVKVNNRKVCCHGDGSDEGSGHPLIYLDMGEEKEIACPYCETTFVHECTVEAVTEKEEGKLQEEI
ncbi:zinc-finger domain-containing protein [Wolbachia endosymbiont of Folsomia candida]|uniref:zinc-finger domain-containing protein n=1 Tax=Wolbachia endosymbiont of Folsomia candida TaxID=169402 RepID=UPI000A96EEBF|nr:zinc-finger domain-containing protein [Wolbachia endosymbiont of Folsomia candida]APR98444.1 zinc-finger domain-containing protein [Wolbachia endosymbiont of Folsomia candida]